MFVCIYSCGSGSSQQNNSSRDSYPTKNATPQNVSSSTSDSGQENRNSNSKKETSEPPNRVSKVDWENFTYPWYPKGYTPPYKKRKITLKDSKFEFDDKDLSDGPDNVSMELRDVSYFDITNDGKEEAIVSLAGVVTFNSFSGCSFVYTIEDGHLKLLWQHEDFDRANGGLRSLRVQDGNLIVEQYSDKEGGGLCCPKIYIRTKYKWDGNRFVEIQSETLNNTFAKRDFCQK
jgi:hypothetical protein